MASEDISIVVSHVGEPQVAPAKDSPSSGGPRFLGHLPRGLSLPCQILGSSQAADAFKDALRSHLIELERLVTSEAQAYAEDAARAAQWEAVAPPQPNSSCVAPPRPGMSCPSPHSLDYEADVWGDDVRTELVDVPALPEVKDGLSQYSPPMPPEMFPTNLSMAPQPPSFESMAQAKQDMSQCGAPTSPTRFPSFITNGPRQPSQNSATSISDEEKVSRNSTGVSFADGDEVLELQQGQRSTRSSKAQRSRTRELGARRLAKARSCGSQLSEVTCQPSQEGSGMSNPKWPQALEAALSVSRDMPVETARNTMPFWQRLRYDSRLRLLVLDSIMGFIIMANCVTIGVSTDVEPDWVGWAIVDFIFAAIFTLEIIIKIRLEGLKEYCVGDDRYWHLFEASLVLLAAVEIIFSFVDLDAADGSKLSILRVVRLARIARILRVCRLQMFCDLIVMIKGTLGGIKTLGLATGLISLPMYAFALAFRETLGHMASEGHGAENFSTVGLSFFTVYRCFVAGECTDTQGRPIFALVSKHYGWYHGFAYCAVLIFMSFGLFNVIVAIFVENVLAGAKTNDQIMKRQRLRDQSFFAGKMMNLLAVLVQARRSVYNLECEEQVCQMRVSSMLEELGDYGITRHIFERACKLPDVIEIFKDLDVADEDFSDLFATLDSDGDGVISVEDLFEGIDRLRGDARRSDIIAINLKIQKMHMDMQLLCGALINDDDASDAPMVRMADVTTEA